MSGFSPPFALRRLLLLGVLGAILAGSLSPEETDSPPASASQRLELARLELQHPLHAVATGGRRLGLNVDIPPLEPGVAAHVVVARGSDLRVWVNGRLRARLTNLPAAPLAWSPRQRLWIGGGPNSPGVPARFRRVAFFDRALGSADVLELWRGRPETTIGERMGPALVLPGNLQVESSGGIRPISLVLPPDGELTAGSLTLRGSPARSSARVAELVSRVVARQAFTFEVWFEPLAALRGPRRTLVAIAEGDEDVNLALELARSSLEVRVRAAYPSLRRVRDLALNLLAYAVFGAALAWSRRRGAAVVQAALLGLGLSLAVEAAQLVCPGRVPSFIDLASNAAGAALGAALVGIASRGVRNGSPRDGASDGDAASGGGAVFSSGGPPSGG